MADTLQSVYHEGIPALPQVREFAASPPRPLYFAYVPAALIIAGVFSWVISGSDGLALGSFVGAAIALFSLWDWLFLHAPTRLSTLLGMSLLLGYGVGSVNTWLTLPRGSATLGEQFGVPPGGLARGIAAVLFASALLYLLGEIFEKPLFDINFRLVITSETRSLVYFGTLAMLAGYFTHALLLAGTAQHGGHINVFGMFLAWLYRPLTALAVAAFITAGTPRERLWCGVSALVLILMGAVQGRRPAIYATVEILFVLGLTGFRWRDKPLRNLVLIILLGGLLALDAFAFILFRIAPVEGGKANSTAITVRAEAAGRIVKQGDALAVAAQATKSNAESRTFVLAFLANILDASSRQTPALGKDALSLMESTIPTIIDPNKNRTFSEEEYVDQHFGFAYGDQANSVLTGGATDFGLLGVLVYPLLMVMLFRLVYLIASAVLKPLPLLIVALVFVGVFLETEEILSGYFSKARNAILFGLVIQVFLIASRLRFRARPDGV